MGDVAMGDRDCGASATCPPDSYEVEPVVFSIDGDEIRTLDDMPVFSLDDIIPSSERTVSSIAEQVDQGLAPAGTIDADKWVESRGFSLDMDGEANEIIPVHDAQSPSLDQAGTYLPAAQGPVPAG